MCPSTKSSRTCADVSTQAKEPPPLPQSPSQLASIKDIIRRDLLFLILVGIALNIISYVETHAADADIRGMHHVNNISQIIMSISQSTKVLPNANITNYTPTAVESTINHHSHPNIVDAGYILTSPLHQFLVQHPAYIDLLALLNSLVLILPSIYIIWVTLWHGDYTLSFRLLATQLFRSFCGWFTYLPPDPDFLMSIYDFPEVLQCLFTPDFCSSLAQSGKHGVLPFVSFFSGHVACTLIVANHLYTRNRPRWSLILHVFNLFQIIRLLATRGHYSIDIIIGWVVGSFLSKSVEPFGISYTQGQINFQNFIKLQQEHKIPLYFFETLTGIDSNLSSPNQSHHSRFLNHSSTTTATATTTATTTTTTATSKSSNSNENDLSTCPIQENGQEEGGEEEDVYLIQSMTTAKIAAEYATQLAKESHERLRQELSSRNLPTPRPPTTDDLINTAKKTAEYATQLARESHTRFKESQERFRQEILIRKHYTTTSLWKNKEDLESTIMKQKMDLMRFLNLAQLKMEELLREEARLIHVWSSMEENDVEDEGKNDHVLNDSNENSIMRTLWNRTKEKIKAGDNKQHSNVLNPEAKEKSASNTSLTSTAISSQESSVSVENNDFNLDNALNIISVSSKKNCRRVQYE